MARRAGSRAGLSGSLQDAWAGGCAHPSCSGPVLPGQDSPGAQRRVCPGSPAPSLTLRDSSYGPHSHSPSALVSSVTPATQQGPRVCTHFTLKCTPGSPLALGSGGSGRAQSGLGEEPAEIPAHPLGFMGCQPAGRPLPCPALLLHPVPVGGAFGQDYTPARSEGRCVREGGSAWADCSPPFPAPIPLICFAFSVQGRA